MALMESVVLTAGAGGPQNNAALEEKGGEMVRSASPLKRIAALTAGV
jgi:hypothetical protein